MPRGKTYWMISTSLDNFRLSKDRDFTLQGVKTHQRRKAQRMEPGDRLVYYIPDLHGFAGTCTVTSKCFESHDAIWKSEGKHDDYPWRVNIEPVAILAEQSFLNALEIGPRLEYVKKWPPELWFLAFQGNLHILPRADFELLESESRKTLKI
jgi:predicted RNA-binding protein